jgi:hypothetical protein
LLLLLLLLLQIHIGMSAKKSVWIGGATITLTAAGCFASISSLAGVLFVFARQSNFKKFKESQIHDINPLVIWAHGI